MSGKRERREDKKEKRGERRGEWREREDMEEKEERGVGPINHMDVASTFNSDFNIV